MVPGGLGETVLVQNHFALTCHQRVQERKEAIYFKCP